MGEDTVCLPADLCQPACENCHNVSFVFYECGHGAADDPCSTTHCFRNTIDTATCEFFPSRLGPPKCNTQELATGRWARQEVIGLEDASCASYDDGPPHHLITLYKGCGATCATENILMRCDALGCEGPVVDIFDRTPARSCGCP